LFSPPLKFRALSLKCMELEITSEMDIISSKRKHGTAEGSQPRDLTRFVRTRFDLGQGDAKSISPEEIQSPQKLLRALVRCVFWPGRRRPPPRICGSCL
jgi:hypothetical protein